jgi:cytochrome P450
LQARTYIRNLISDIVCHREATPSDTASSDYVSALLEDPDYNDPILVRDTLVTLLFAGRDNTQNALAWSMHALLQHPAWMAEMTAEAESLNRCHEAVLPYSRLGVRIPCPSRFPIEHIFMEGLSYPSSGVLRDHSPLAWSPKESASSHRQRRFTFPPTPESPRSQNQ